MYYINSLIKSCILLFLEDKRRGRFDIYYYHIQFWTIIIFSSEKLCLKGR